MRTVETIHQEYTQVCAKAGHLQYQILTLTKELSDINEQLRAFNAEAIELTAQQKKAAADDKLVKEVAQKIIEEGAK